MVYQQMIKVIEIFDAFEYVLKHERKPTNRIPVTIIACTGKYQNLNLN